VETIEAAQQGIEQARRLVRVREIGGVHGRAAAKRGDLSGDLREPIGTARSEQDVAAGTRKLQRDAPPDALAPAGHERDLSAQLHSLPPKCFRHHGWTGKRYTRIARTVKARNPCAAARPRATARGDRQAERDWWPYGEQDEFRLPHGLRD